MYTLFTEYSFEVTFAIHVLIDLGKLLNLLCPAA